LRGDQKIVRSDTILALLPPAIAISWVIADAATGFVSADRAIQTIPPAAQIVSEAGTVIHKSNQKTIVICSRYNGVAASSALPQANLLRLCRAGLKFTTSLPKI
jgi:hypothetical protein